MEECCVCLSNTYNLSRLKCKHPVCLTCYNKIKNKICPLCRCKMETTDLPPEVKYKEYYKFSNMKEELFKVSRRSGYPQFHYDV